MTVILLLVSLGFLSSCGFASKDISEDRHLSEFIIGKWQTENQVQDDYCEYTDIYLVEFVNEDTLKFKVESPYAEVNNTLQYEFLDDKTLSVKNIRSKGGKWEAYKEGENLRLCIWSSENCFLFKRIE